MAGPNFRPVIFECRKRLSEVREKIRRRHDENSPGIQVSGALTGLLDAVVLTLYEAALAEIGDRELPSLVALVAHGGYGRQDVAPHSDVDLMLLYAAGSESRVQPLAQWLNRDIADAGLSLGFSLRTRSEAVRLALADVTVFTSLAESRFLAGNRQMYQRFFDALRRGAMRRSRSLVAMILESRRQERDKYGETVFLLTPNVKRSLGGLRDVQLVRWIGFARFGETDLRAMETRTAIRPGEQRQLRRSHDFLLRVRNELHFHFGKAQDLLDREEQVRQAERFGYRGSHAVLPVEEFMRDYFEHASQVHYTAENFAAAARMPGRLIRLLKPLGMHNVAGDFRVGPQHIAATRHELRKVCNDLGELVRMMVLASMYNKRIDPATWETVRQSTSDWAEKEITPETIKQFLALMSRTARLGELLRRLHELRVLERIVPGMRHARCLLQFNDYHKYTVDEHSIRTVEAVADFLQDDGPLGEAYRAVKDKRTLHLAALIHDMGKGYTRDHCEVGEELAVQAAERFNLPEEEAENLRFLVRHHLSMSHLAQFRDINDPKVITQFGSDVGSADVLQMLYVLTAADLAAAGPGKLNAWILALITQLYRSTRRELTGDEMAKGNPAADRARRDELREQVAEAARPEWWERQLDALPPALLYHHEPDQVLSGLRRLESLGRSQAIAWARYLPEHEAIEYTVGAYEDLSPGVFHRLTGVLTRERNEIRSAEIHTLADGLILDRFYVEDQQHEGKPPGSRLDSVCGKLVDAIERPTGEPPRFPQVWQRPRSQVVDQLAMPRSSVRLDNSTSDRYTIIDIFARNRTGLLYTITRELFLMDLSVHIAKIGTHQDQVVDVFYVTDQAGAKIQNMAWLRRIRQRLKDRIRDFEQKRT